MGLASDFRGFRGSGLRLISWGRGSLEGHSTQFGV